MLKRDPSKAGRLPFAQFRAAKVPPHWPLLTKCSCELRNLLLGQGDNLEAARRTAAALNCIPNKRFTLPWPKERAYSSSMVPGRRCHYVNAAETIRAAKIV